MHNFIFKNPVQVVFGTGQITQLSTMIPANSKVLLTYGGGSIKQNGVYNQVKEALKSFAVFEFNGIEANPEYETLLKAVNLCKQEQIDFILAVGGGSVVDGTKFIAAAVNYPLEDKWQILHGQADKISNVIPFAAVLTLPATGSETNPAAVVSRKQSGEKLGFLNPLVYPQFAILDPTVTYSLPPRQLANGLVDPFIHVTEQYLTTDLNTPIQDGYAETILRTLIEVAPIIISGQKNDVARANWMWSATNALNGFIGVGVDHDWATHMIGHELTALYGFDHAQSLALLAPQLWRYKKQQKEAKLLKFARNVWGIRTLDPQTAIEEAILQTEVFFHSLGMKTTFSDYKININASLVADKLAEHIQGGIGEHRDIHHEDIIKIINMAV